MISMDWARTMRSARDSTIYLLFDRGKTKLYESIAVARSSLDWPADGRDCRERLAK